MASCQTCGTAVTEGARFCPACGREQPGFPASAAAAPAAIPEKYVAAALLSFFLPGFGQMAKGQTLKAALILFGVFSFAVLSSTKPFGVPLFVVLWLWQVYDAYNSPPTA